MGLFSKLFKPKIKDTSYIDEETEVQLLSERKAVFYFDVAGSFLDERQARIKHRSFKRMGNRKQVYLVPEPDNEYDKNAICVYANRIGSIGYVPAAIAVEVNKFIEANPKYTLRYETLDARPWDDQDDELKISIKLYELTSSKEAIAQEKSKESSSTFSESEQSYIDAIKTIYPSLALSAIKEKDYILLQCAQNLFLKLKIGKRLKYVLVPENTNDLENISLELSPPSNAEAGSIRIMLTDVEDIEKLKTYLDIQEAMLQQKISQFDLLCQQLGKIK